MRILKIVVVILWIMLLAFVYWKRESFSLDHLLDLQPDGYFGAALMMLGIFALKSMTFFLYAGLLYIADGMIFPYPLAVLVSALGAWIMITLPYWIGKWLGKDIRTSLLDRYPKLKKLDDVQSSHAFLSIFVIRVLVKVPSDPAALYFGASQIPYPAYAAASLLTCIPNIITFPLFGYAIKDPTSPAFLAGTVFQGIWMLVGLLGYWIYSKKKKSRSQKPG